MAEPCIQIRVARGHADWWQRYTIVSITGRNSLQNCRDSYAPTILRIAIAHYRDYRVAKHTDGESNRHRDHSASASVQDVRELVRSFAFNATPGSLDFDRRLLRLSRSQMSACRISNSLTWQKREDFQFRRSCSIRFCSPTLLFVDFALFTFRVFNLTVYN